MEINPRDPLEIFEYSGHATLAYGYTVFNANTSTDAYQYRFLKLHDGWVDDPTTHPRYVCWDMLEQSELDIEEVNGEYIEHSIKVEMLTLVA